MLLDSCISCGFFLLVASSDSTSAVIESFVLAMTSYPEVQKKAQEELDSVLCGRLPTHADIPSLPYLTAVIKEVIRYVHQCSFSIYTERFTFVFSVGDRLFPWVSTCYSYSAMFDLPTTYTGVPHYTDEDTFYNGYFIPAGSVLLANAW